MEAELYSGSSDSMTDTSSSEVSWITWYCSLPEHDFFLEVPEEYIEDDFNLAGLSTLVPLYDEALDMILDLEVDTSDSDASDRDSRMHGGQIQQQQQQQHHSLHQQDDPDLHLRDSGSGSSGPGANGNMTALAMANSGSMASTGSRNGPKSASHLRMVEASAEILYGLIHARFLLTKQGLQVMGQRYEHLEFGRCPRAGCGGCGVVPSGQSDIPGVEPVKMYCPRCTDLYHPKKARFHNIDGASFGTTFASLLFLTLPHLVPAVFSFSGDGRRVDTRNPERAMLERARSAALVEDDYDESDDTNDSDKDSFEDSEDSFDSENDDDDEDDDDDDDPIRRQERASKRDMMRRGSSSGYNRDGPLPDYWMFTPRVFGFRVSERAKVGPRMGWLRWKEGLVPPGAHLQLGDGSGADGQRSVVAASSGSSRSSRVIASLPKGRLSATGRGSVSLTGGESSAALMAAAMHGGPAGMLPRHGSLDETGLMDEDEEAGNEDDGSLGQSGHGHAHGNGNGAGNGSARGESAERRGRSHQASAQLQGHRKGTPSPAGGVGMAGSDRRKVGRHTPTPADSR
ncbi:casein kinase II regulatory subunit-domain-containing protein [Entophlyctis helioformis]|nr:casein kinase II regulatory subunit-domain-containing protein [Entophlyctis helioformis]